MQPQHHLDCAGRAPAMLAQALRRVGPHTRPPSDLDECLTEIRSARAQARANARGDQCDAVSEALEGRFGWPRMEVSYLSVSGAVICAWHNVNLTRDGSLLDANADRFGEGHDVRLLHPGDTDYGRYRPAFQHDWNPASHPADFTGLDKDWQGVPDREMQLRAEQALGPYWWLRDTGAMRDYLMKEIALRPWQAEIERSIALLEQRADDLRIPSRSRPV